MASNNKNQRGISSSGNESENSSSATPAQAPPQARAPPRPNSLLVGPASQLRAPSSLLSGALPPTLLQEGESGTMSSGGEGGGAGFFHSGTSGSGSGSTSTMAMRPRRLWNIRDTSLKRIPKGYPPLNPQCTTYVGDASPSVVAVRISECFRKRSIAVEYDEETVTAMALTVDRCHFQVQLYKGNPELFSHGVVVECLRISGSVISFHAACQAVLQAALGQSTGDDTDRSLHQCNGREFQHLPDALMNPQSTLANNPRTPSLGGSVAAQALEQSKELVHKDRLDTQVLGMERLVDLTTPSMCGKDIALFTSLQLVDKDPEWIVHRIIINDEIEGNLSSSFLFGSASSSALLDANISHSTIGSSEITSDEGRHASKIRAFGLRALCNALSNLSEAQLLTKILNRSKEQGGLVHPLLETSMLDSLVEDLKGVNRPPSVVQSGTNTLASVHEAAIAIRILRIMGEHSARVQEFLGSDIVLERLEVARTSGRATHIVLQQESERTYAKLTEDIRSC